MSAHQAFCANQIGTRETSVRCSQICQYKVDLLDDLIGEEITLQIQMLNGGRCNHEQFDGFVVIGAGKDCAFEAGQMGAVTFMQKERLFVGQVHFEGAFFDQQESFTFLDLDAFMVGRWRDVD